MWVTCEDDPTQPGCETGPQPPPPGQQVGYKLPSGMTWRDCRQRAPEQDYDQDGFHDRCEYELAFAFRPLLAISPYDDGAGREPYWSVQRATEPGDGGYPYNPTLRIFYALAYYRDYGDPSWTGFTGHDGDSEFVILDIGASDSSFAMTGAFMSAHWGSADSESSEWRVYWDFSYHTPVYQGRPTIWVAQDKHANYYSGTACQIGGYKGSDNCDGAWWSATDQSRTIGVLANANLGNQLTRKPPYGVAAQPTLPLCRKSRNFISPVTECFWDPTDHFRGWRTESGSSKSSPYHKPLSYFGF